MPIDVKLWSESFSQLPSWPCPHCKTGKLILEKESLKMTEPAFSKAWHNHPAYEFDWAVERFVATMKCSDHECGEVVRVLGDAPLDEDYDEEKNELGVSQSLRPRAIYPAPPIITVPNETPPAVLAPLELAFQLYWTDIGASANRIRTSVERLLDNLKIPKSEKTAKNKRRRLTLAERINLFEVKHTAYGDFLHALRNVGNVGTHASADRQAILGAFEIYEESLAQLYGMKNKKLKALAKKLTKQRGHL